MAASPGGAKKLVLEGAVIDIDYLNKGDSAYIRMLVKCSDGKARELFDKSFRPYFYLVPSRKIDAKDVESVIAQDNGRVMKVAGTERASKTLMGKPVEAFRVFAENPAHVPKLSAAMKRYGECFEDDIPFAKRYSIDNDVEPLANYSMKAHEEQGMLVLDSLERKEGGAPKLNVMCFDIEVYNPLGNPRPAKDPIIMISYRMLGENGARGVITFKDIALPFVERADDERAMINRFIEKVNELDVDVLVGYNSANFDVRYFIERTQALRMPFDLNRFEGSTRIESHGLVDKVKIGGRIHVDAYLVVRFVAIVGAAEHILKLNSYTLKNVYEAISKDTKLVVDKRNIFKMWDGGEDELEELAKYNLNDSQALMKVYEDFIPIMMQLASVTHSVLSDVCVSTTGQLVEFMLMRNSVMAGELIPNKPEEYETRARLRNPIEGAYVKTPEPGIYSKLALFDFRGLYPSIIISHNIDPSSLCNDCKDYYESPTGARFDKNRKSIMPQILKMLIDQRSSVKKEYKKDPNNIMLGSRSQALKIVSNSFYGYLGYARSRWYSRECAESVTAWGRQYIKMAMDESSAEGFKVLYGDSVAKGTKVRVRLGTAGSISYKNIEELFEKADRADDERKEYYKPANLFVETLDSSGNVTMKKVRHVMRHKIGKRMFRVHFTNTLHIDVTEDHSLIGFAGLSVMKGEPNKRFVEIRPLDIGKRVRSIVVKRQAVRDRIRSRGYSKELYELMGFFIGDGSFDYNKEGKCYYLRLALGKEEDELIGKLIVPLRNQKVIKSFWRKGRGDISVNGLGMIRLFEKEMKKEGHGRGRSGKKIPEFIFREKAGKIFDFLRGLFSSDGTVIIRNGKPIIRYTTIDAELALQLRRLLWEVGISNSVFKENTQNAYKGKPSGTYSYHVVIKSKMPFVKNIGFLNENKMLRLEKYEETSRHKKKIKDKEFDIAKVMKVEEIAYSDYVYDMEVNGVHRFFANDTLVHNTDSIILVLGDKSNADSLEFAKRFNQKLPEDMELELEDFYSRGVFVGKKTAKESSGAKKKYALINQKGRIKIRGFELVRRDWSKIARETQRSVLETILKEGSAEKAAAIVKDVIKRLRDGKVPLGELAISTQIRKSVDSYDVTSPEVAAARAAIKEGTKTREDFEGSVISYIITKHGSTTSDKARLEEFAKDYDAEYYINKQVIPATMRILKELDFKEEELIGGGTQKKLM